MTTTSEKKLLELTQRAENALAEIRNLAISPVEVKYGDKANILVHPLAYGERLDVCCGDWGHTTVNYGVEGVLVDVYSGAACGFEIAHTAAIPREDLDGQAKACRQDSQQAAKTVTLIVPASAVSENGDGPIAACIEVNKGLFERLKKLQSCVDTTLGITQLVVFDAPSSWLPKGIENDLRFNHAQLVITTDRFWYSDQPKHSDYLVECKIVGTEELLSVYENAKDGETVIHGDDEFQEKITDLLEGATNV